MSILEVRNLTKKYPLGGGWFKKTQEFFTAVNGISFDLKQQETLAILGPNGAGKTTTMYMLLGTLTPTSGTITYFGKDLKKERSDIMQSVGFASAYTKLPGRLTVAENLDIYGRLYGLSAHERDKNIRAFLQAFGVWNLRDNYVAGLSAGQMTRVMLAKAFLPKPKIVLLDEPTASLDPDIVQDVRSFIKEQQEQYGTTILLASHNMVEVTELCDRVLVLKQGNIIASDTPQNLAATVASVRVELIVVDGLKRMVAYTQSKQYVHKVKDRHIAIEVDEHAIAGLLSDLATLGAVYSHITIAKPTLEDYFLHIAAQEGV
ncbi:MAG TPA: ABC transporter ATP-binding protein [Candidatus Limnocylindria bacterium]|nr:ABC transporter ATP-binding protein [Candidatus Limnocylindria bacterium]